MSVGDWVPICPYETIESERGVAALIGERQVAVFRTHDGSLYAIDNLDPCSGAHVMSRGIVGTRGDAVVVSSPMHKQTFDLRTGVCLDAPDVSLRIHPVRRRDSIVEVGRVP